MEDGTSFSSSNIDPRSGFHHASRTFHSLRPPLHLPPPNATVSAAAYTISLRRNSPWPDSVTALIDSATGHRLSYAEFIHHVETLASNLTSILKLSKGDTALVLSHNLMQVPILCLALLSIGVIVSPANPLSTRSDLTRVFHLSKPVIIFAATSVAAKTHELPNLRLGTVFLDSPEFDSLMRTRKTSGLEARVKVSQSDVAAILYSSGTTGNVKGVMLTHRNLTALAVGYDAVREERKEPPVFLYTMPFFHVYGFTFSLRAMVLSETVVIMERFRFREMLRAVERFRVTNIAMVPPLVVALTKDGVTDGYDLTSLVGIACGAAPLGKETAEAFKSKFPGVVIIQGYGLTESTAGVARSTNEEIDRVGTTGRLSADVEAKIVNPNTGEAMLPGQQGELWIRGPTIMKGYAGDPEATSATLVDGWLRTGDLCFFDDEGFLYVVDRLKELIKYKGYQVAPAELEQLLHSHPEIKDAAVIPYPDEEAGQVPMAFVVRQPQSSLGQAEIINFVAKQVAPYKKIRRVAFIDSIPKNAAGKILRKNLHKLALQTSYPRL
ncbi:4-coumarate--CoA ligase-like 9 [Abrus precatorius]|uniref:4-coumarate--CoA ligase-like 9 n=1 Tax=Abrus precatorius TaxID=3816 RepID=A0A8B8LU72_ABRPR|nr:4-coumarate--CoA ligase-like 9 [Abrus precatorius]